MTRTLQLLILVWRGRKYYHCYDNLSLASSSLHQCSHLKNSATANVIPSTTYAVFYVFRDPALLVRVRENIAPYFPSTPLQPPAEARALLNHKSMVKEPLLSSIYAETLRLHVNAYSAVTSPHEDARLGKWFLPKNTLAVLNSEISHMDTDFWNTQGQRHPVTSFWADRFLVDPRDPSSGPMRPELKPEKQAVPAPVSSRDGEAYFSTKGLEGSWFPYGGKWIAASPVLENIRC